MEKSERPYASDRNAAMARIHAIESGVCDECRGKLGIKLKNSPGQSKKGQKMKKGFDVRKWFSKRSEWFVRVPLILCGVMLALYLFEFNSVHVTTGKIVEVIHTTQAECGYNQDENGKINKTCKHVTYRNEDSRETRYRVVYKDYEGDEHTTISSFSDMLGWANEADKETVSNVADLERKYTIVKFIHYRGCLPKKGANVKVYYLMGNIFGDHSWTEPFVDARVSECRK